jgi:predicted kinase
MTQKQAIDWLNSQVGVYRDFDGQWQAQCVDLFNFYYQFLTGRNPYSDGYGVPGAKDLWNVSTNRFTKIPDSSTLVPQPGDILVYGSGWGGGYGHVEMVTATDSRGVTIVGNNFTGNPRLAAQRTYRTWAGMKGLLGVMRFNFNKGDVPMTPAEERTAYQIVLNRAMEHAGSGRTGYKFIVDAKAEVEAQRNAANQAIRNLQVALANEQAKPPKEVVKEVEKIVTEYVDRPVEVIVEVEPTWLKAVVAFIRKVLHIS